MPNFNFDRDVPYDRWSTSKLAETLRDRDAEISRLELLLDDQVGKHVGARRDLKRANQRIKVVQKKPKGKVDKVGRKRIRELALHTAASNVLSSAMWIPASMAAGEFSLYMLASQLTNALLSPLQMYIQKRQEVH
jgi:arginine deiminase